MDREFATMRLKDLKPFKWYRVKWGEPGRYVASTGINYGHMPMALVVKEYVAETLAGRMEMEVDILAFHIRELSEITPKEREDVKRAIKNSKTKIALDLFSYMFAG